MAVTGDGGIALGLVGNGPAGIGTEQLARTAGVERAQVVAGAVVARVVAG